MEKTKVQEFCLPVTLLSISISLKFCSVIDYFNMEEFREIIGRLGGGLVLEQFCVIVKKTVW